MKLKSMFNKMGGLSVAISVLMISTVWAGEYPIIFLHGHTSGWKYWNGTEPGHTDNTNMKKIINQQYGGYTAGSPLNCVDTTTLSSTGGNTKKIYNFQYYHIDWYDDKEMGGAIGSNGYCYPDDYYGEIAYINSLAGGSWAQALATFIDKVRTATGATKVDIVTHSMGGLVARAAIKWYGCASKVRKLLMIATPNHGIQGPSPWSNWSQMGVPDWMAGGENQEMDGAVLFYKYSNPDVKKTWTEFLNEGNWAQGVKYATISGNLDPYIVPSNEDGIVDHEWVVLSGADFNPIHIYAAHGSSNGSWLQFTTRGELSLTACTYSCEFIKKWIIDDNTSHNGASSIGSPALVPNPWPLAYPYDGPIYVSPLLNDFSKALVTQAEMNGVDDEYLVKAFPVYQYTDAYPGLPVFIIDPTQYRDQDYAVNIWNYDMDGIVSQTEEAGFVIVEGMGPGGYVRIISPNGGEGYQPGNPVNIQWESNCPCVSQHLFYSTNGGGYWYPIPPSGAPIPANDRSYIWTAPSVSSASCRVKVVFNLDINTPISDMSDGNFSIGGGGGSSSSLYLQGETIRGPDYNIRLWWRWLERYLQGTGGTVDSADVNEYGLFDNLDPEPPPIKWFSADTREGGYEAPYFPYTCWIGGYHPYFYEGFYYSNSVTIYEGGGPDPIITKCSDSLALYPSWSQKIVTDSLGIIHICFTSGDSIYHTFSKDNGETFSDPTAFAQGKFPAVGLSNLGLEVIYLRKSEIYFTRKTDKWNSPILIYQNPSLIRISPPVFAVDRSNLVAYLSWQDEYTDHSQLNTARINLNDPGPVSESRLDWSSGHDAFISSSISLTKKGSPLISWSKGGKVYLNDGSETKVIDTGDGYAIHPMVTAVGDNIKLIWLTDNDGKKQLNYTEKCWWGWTKPVAIKEGNLASNPIIIGTGHIFYCEDENDTTYLNYLGISEDGWHTHSKMVVYNDLGIHDLNAIHYATYSRAASDQGQIHIVFYTDDEIIKMMSIPSPEIPITYLNCGTGQSPYTTLAYQNLIYSNMPSQIADVHSQKLGYRFTNLDPKKSYCLKITAFQNGEDEICEKVKVDDYDLGQFKVPRKKINKFKECLPVDCYEDGEIYLTLEKEYGFATASEIFIYEYEGGIKPGGGIQSSNEEPLFISLCALPNPFSNSISFSFNLQTEKSVSLKLYDITGKLIRTLIEKPLNPGQYAIRWDGKDNLGKKLPSGVYFLKFSDAYESRIKKIVLIK